MEAHELYLTAFMTCDKQLSYASAAASPEAQGHTHHPAAAVAASPEAQGHTRHPAATAAACWQLDTATGPAYSRMGFRLMLGESADGIYVHNAPQTVQKPVPLLEATEQRSYNGT
jgi:hypothetical protein